MNLDQALHTFIAESRELLDDMEDALLKLGGADDRAESINAIFRAAHTIKGSAGLFGLDGVVTFTHLLESLLDEVRAGVIALDEPLVTLLLSCGDHIAALVTAVEAGRDTDGPELAAPGAALADRLRERLGTTQAAPAPSQEGDTGPSAEPELRRLGDSGGADHWHISLRFGPSVLRNGMDPLSFLRYLGTLGRIVHVATLADTLPALDALDPEICSLGFEIAFESAASKATIENVFEFVLDDCQLHILPPRSRVAEYVEMIKRLPEETTRLGDILVACGSLTAHELQAALHSQRCQPEPVAPIGHILVDQGAIQPALVEAALAKQRQVKEAKAQESRSVRVDADKLDRLINLVGELVIAAAGANLAARSIRQVQLQEAHSTLATLVEEVRDSALQLRMVKIGATFNRFQRVVHDVSREIGKDIQLVIQGEDTELDKTVVEKIADPLTHLVRNAMDHGIEPAALRLERGKPARGTLTLNAYHDSGTIVIEVSDDGGGLNREKILAKAVERGLVETGRALSDQEIYALIFEPGFSTADTVTRLSGRGVGMDVVKRNIMALRGSVDVASRPGLGTTVMVRLPLTLAIINGFQVGVGRSVFVLPLEMVDECVEFAAHPGHDYTDLRGQVLPFIRLRELFELGESPGPRQNIVVVKYAGEKFGLVVDALHGEAQTVIKPLSSMFAQVKGISGSSILGNGEVALILDIPALLRHIQSRSAARSAAIAA
jgi:two-component system chemotaxis sensor kinase CheA